MSTRIALIGIIVEREASVEQLNRLLHEYGDAPQDMISAMSGKIGSLDGISVKTVYSNIADNPM